MKFSIFLMSLILLILMGCIKPVVANYQPPENNSERRKASGTRGCPFPLGELYILEANLIDNDNNIFHQETGLNTPTLIYEIESQQEETFLITVYDNQDNLILEKYLSVSPEQKRILITFEQPIQENIGYQITAGLLCEGEKEGAKIINSLLFKVNELTSLDKLSQFNLYAPKLIENQPLH